MSDSVPDGGKSFKRWLDGLQKEYKCGERMLQNGLMWRQLTSITAEKAVPGFGLGIRIPDLFAETLILAAEV